MNSPEPPRTTTAPSPIRSILYIEDDELNWLVTERRMREQYDIARARGAREAFAMLGQRKFDLILVDVMLAGSDLDGIELTRVLRGKPREPPPPFAIVPEWARKVPTVFVTAYGSRFTKEELLEAGAADVILKPVNFGILQACMTRVLSNR